MRAALLLALPCLLAAQSSVNTTQTFQAPPIFPTLSGQGTLGTDIHGKLVAGTGGTSTLVYTTRAANPANVWVMNDGGSSTTFADSIAGNTVTASTEPAWTYEGGYLGQVPLMATTGEPTYVSANHSAFNPDNTPFSISLWFSTQSISVKQELVSQYSEGSHNPGFDLNIGNTTGGGCPSSGGISFFLNDNAQNGTAGHLTFCGNTPIISSGTGPRYHVVVVIGYPYTIANAALYVNNIKQTLITVANTFQSANNNQSNANIYIGSADPAVLTASFEGVIAGVALYNSALSAADVAALYHAGPWMAQTTSTGTADPSFTSGTGRVQASQVPNVKIGCSVPTGVYASGSACSLSDWLTNSELLSQILMLASPQQPVDLVLDGGATGTLIGPISGNFTVEGAGAGAGLFLAAGANNIAIGNSWAFNPINTVPTSSTLPALGGNVVIKSLLINGNQSNNASNSGPHGSPQIQNIFLAGLDNVLIDNVQSWANPAFNLLLDVVNSIVVQNSAFVSYFNGSSGGDNTDGIHVDGNSANIVISNTCIQAGDDSIGLNSPEAQGGNIGGVQVTNLMLGNCTGPWGSGGAFVSAGSTYDVARIYNGSGQTIGPVTFQGVTATTTNYGFAFTLGSTTPADAMNVTITDADIAGPQFAQLQGGFGTITCTACIWRGPTSAYAMFATTGTTNIQSLSVRNSGIYRNTSGNSAAWPVQVNSGGTIVTADLDLWCRDGPSGPYSACPQLVDVPSGGAITTLQLPLWLDISKITNLASSGSLSRVTNITGVIPWTFTVSALPSCTSAMTNRASTSVSDATLPTFLGTLTGGGAVETPVRCNGSNWIAY